MGFGILSRNERNPSFDSVSDQLRVLGSSAIVFTISSVYRQSRSSTTPTDRRESRRFIGNSVIALRNPPSGWRSIEAPVSGGNKGPQVGATLHVSDFLSPLTPLGLDFISYGSQREVSLAADIRKGTRTKRHSNWAETLLPVRVLCGLYRRSNATRRQREAS